MEVQDHLRVYRILTEAVVNARFETRVLACKSAPTAWRVIFEAVFPQTDEEKDALRQDFEHLRWETGDNPDDYFSRAERRLP